jgi:hypothetical protein
MASAATDRRIWSAAGWGRVTSSMVSSSSPLSPETHAARTERADETGIR